MPVITHNTINTVDRVLFDYNNPSFEGFSVDGLARAAAKICRFGGHTDRFYSVAEHCVVVSKVLPKDLAIYGLVHDLHEAVMGDMPSPLKRMMPEYKALEKQVEAELYKWLGLEVTPEIKAAVKKADTLVYLAEREKLLPGLPQSHQEWLDIPLPGRCTEDWETYIDGRAMVSGYGWGMAHDLYMRRFEELSPVGTIRQNRMVQQ